MREQAESRKKIQEGINKRKTEMDERGERMGFVVEDNKNVADTSRKLNLATTKEGAKEIKKHMKQAEESTHKEFEKQNRDLESKVKDCHTAEQDLQKRTESAKKDASNARTASEKINETKEAKRFMSQVETTSNKDAGFTDHEKERQKQDREKSEQRREKQKQRLAATKVQFRN